MAKLKVLVACGAGIATSTVVMKRVEDLFEENIKDRSYPLRLIVFHANNEEMAMEWKAKLQEKYPDYPIDVSYFGPVIGTHLGEKALALGWMKDIEKLDF